jgi:hypothetical protein
MADIPIAFEAVDLSTEDHEFSRTVHAIRSNIDGTFYAKLEGEGVTAEPSRKYVVKAGDVVLGQFVSVQRATSDAAFQASDTLMGYILRRLQ